MQKSAEVTDRRHPSCLVSSVSAIISLSLALAPCVQAHEGHAALPSKGATVTGNQLLLSSTAHDALGVREAKVSLEDMRRVLRANAQVELPWWQQALVTTLVAGKITHVFVQPGEAVQAGQELARVESLELEVLQREMLRAAAEVELLERLVEQRIPLAEQGAIRGKTLLQSQAELRQAEVQLQIASRKLQAVGIDLPTIAQIRESGQQVRWASIRSPLSGVATRIEVHPGRFVNTTEHLFHVVDTSQVLVAGEVLETDLEAIRVGLPVVVEFSALPGESFSGRIDHVHLTMDRDKRTLEVLVPTENQDGRLRSGMFGRMAIEVRRSQQVVVCPVSAVIQSQGKQYVLLRRGEGKYVRKSVSTGLRDGEHIEIVRGLFPGDRVMVRGQQVLFSLFDGDKEAAAGPSTEAQSESPSPRRVEARGYVVLPTNRKTFVTSMIEGRVARIHVNHSQYVQRGDLLAELDSQEFRSLRLERLRTTERRKWVAATIARLKPLAEQGSVAARELWQAQTEWKTLSHRLDGLSRQMELIGLSAEEVAFLEQENLTDKIFPQTRPPHQSGPIRREENVEQRHGSSVSVAPDDWDTIPLRAAADGWITQFDLIPGQVVNKEDRLFEIQDLQKVWVEGHVYEEDARHVQTGQKAIVTLPAFPERKIRGKVIRIGPTLESSLRVLPIWVEVENPGQLIKEGMLAKVTVLLEAPETSIARKGR